MSLTEKLTNIKTKLTSVLSDINTALVAKGATEVTSLVEVPTAIESVQSGGENTAIDYPEWGFTRPSWWLPRPELILEETTNELWALIEVDANITEHERAEITNGVVVANGRKQFWKMYEPQTHSYINQTINGLRTHIMPTDIKNVIEIIVNSIYPITPIYRYQEPAFEYLQIISGTMLTDGSYNQDGFMHSWNLRVIDCPVHLTNDRSYLNRMFQSTAIIKPPVLIEDGVQKNANFRYMNCKNLRYAGRINANIIDYSFSGCSVLEQVHLTANVTSTTTNTFSGCVKLKDLTVDEGFSASLYIHHSTRFTAEVLHAIIENYADMTGQTAPTFQVGATNLAKIDDEHKAMLEAKNINYL